jgi:hypothetical protein
MRKSKQTRGTRTKRNPRDASPDRQKSSWEPLDDLYGESDGAVDSDMELDTERYESPPPKR